MMAPPTFSKMLRDSLALLSTTFVWIFIAKSMWPNIDIKWICLIILQGFVRFLLIIGDPGPPPYNVPNAPTENPPTVEMKSMQDKEHKE